MDELRFGRDNKGFTFLSLQAALISDWQAEDFESGLCKVIEAGGDTDINGVIVGAVLGARLGFTAIPERWLRRVRAIRKGRVSLEAGADHSAARSKRAGEVAARFHQTTSRVSRQSTNSLREEEILGSPTIDRDLPRDATRPVLHDVAEAEQAVIGLRSHRGLGADPIPNLVELLEERGIKALPMPLDNIDGLTASVPRAGKSVASVIVVNRRN